MIPLLTVMASLAAIGILFVYYTLVFPDPMASRAREHAPVVRILARDGSVLAERGGAHDYVPLALLPRRVTDAVVATEDRRFYNHWGLDPVGMVRALFANIRAGRFVQGGSTLTQQLAKNMFLTPDRTMARKLEELVLALWLEVRLSKDDILELYLNRVYFGAGAYGIEAAAHRYFDKSARELSVAEAAVIAGLLKAPSKYAPTTNREQALTRARSVLAKMRDAGVISAETERRAALEQVRFVERKTAAQANRAEFAIDFVLERLPPLVGSDQSEIIVETTIDPELQRQAGDIVARELTRQGATLDASQGAAVVLDTEGGIRALVGGRDYAGSQFNRAIKARRQPGSAFKPFVYLAALEAGFTPNSLAYDMPVHVGEWSPRNETGKYAGTVTLRQALAQSINTVAVRLLLDVGARRVASVAHRLGITADLREDASLALGTSEVSLLELTGAYGALANGGQFVEPYAIRRVRMSSGRVLYAREPPSAGQVVAIDHVGGMNDMLSAAMAWGTGRRASLALQNAAGKTGTSQEFRDAWFIGYTAHLVAGVWVGNDNGAPMKRVMGGNLPAGIWHEIMRLAHVGKAPLALPGLADPRASPAPAPPATAALPAAVETLPWMQATSSQATPPASSGGVRAQVYPKERIDGDFVARALAGGTLRPSDAEIARSPDVGSAGQQPIVVHPPGQGIMSPVW